MSYSSLCYCRSSNTLTATFEHDYRFQKVREKILHLPQAYAICELKGKNSVAQFQINWTLVCLISVYSTEQLQSDLQSGVN